MKNLNSELFSFRNRYIPALLIIALFSALGFINVKDIVSSIRNEGKVINTSGRQRMLSQKLILLGDTYLKNPNDTNKSRFLDTIKIMEESHFYLLQNSEKNLIELLYYKNTLDLDIKSYLHRAKQIINANSFEDLNSLKNDSESLLDKLDYVVRIYEEEYKKKLFLLEEKGEYLLIGIFIVLLFEWMLIFKPASKNIKKHIEELEEVIKNKINELQKSIDIISENVIYSRTDTKGVITYASKAFCEISGYSQEELLGQPHNLIRHMDMPKEAFRDMWSAIQSGNNWKGEVKNLKKNKDAYWVMAYISPEYDNNGNLVGYAGVRQDITYKKALQELNKNLEKRIVLEIEKNREKDLQIFNSAKMASLGEMIENIAHQWRQPLSSISTMASGMLIAKEFGKLDDENFIYYCNNIVESTRFLSETIDTFRDFIKERKEFKKVILQERIKRTLHIENATFNHYYINLIDNINYSKPIYVNLIVGELTQVLINILNNAKDVLIKNQIANPWIKIDLEHNEGKAIITIEDNAGGIPENILPHIFEPYFTTKHQSQGTGLGLYMSYKIVVENLKGELYVKNSQSGAKFFIILETEPEDY